MGAIIGLAVAVAIAILNAVATYYGVSPVPYPQQRAAIVATSTPTAEHTP